MTPISKHTARGRLRLAVTVTVATIAVSACIPQPPDDAFYRPAPARLTIGPGDVLAARESRFTLDPVALTPVPGVRSWQILYGSTDASGRPNQVSGTVL